MNIDDTINHMFESLLTPDEPLTDWENDFLESIKAQWEKKHSLSVRQREILEKIYVEKTK